MGVLAHVTIEHGRDGRATNSIAMEKRLVTIGLVQMSMTDRPVDNLKKAETMIAEAAKKKAQIVVLPELFLSLYFCQKKNDKAAFDLAESIPGKTTNALSDIAKKHGIILIGGSIFEKASDGKYYNTSPVFGPDGTMLGTYRKTHIPEDILYHEQHYFSPGDTGFQVFDTPFGKICPLICYDQWYPEAARIAALQGAELIVYPTAIGMVDESVEDNITGDWHKMWETAQAGHAACNNVFVAAVNRTGREDNIAFWGGSFIADPGGKVIAKASGSEEVLITTVDLNRVKALQKSWRFFENRRPEVYTKLAK